MAKYACIEYESRDFHLEVEEIGQSKFDNMLQLHWENAMENGFFRYKLDHIKTKILPGKYGFVAQLNIKRAKERRKPHEISSINMPFDPNLFNFSKINSKEVLFTVVPKHWNSLKNNEDINKEISQPSGHILIINISPLEFCNSLMVPYVHRCLPQVLTEDGLKLAVETVLLSLNPALRIGFNSLGGYASVNHYHFHVYYLQQKLYLETAAVQHLEGDCFEIADFPAKGFAFQLLDTNVGSTVKSVMKIVHFLIKNSISYNLFITRGSKFQLVSEQEKIYSTVRIYLWARASSFGIKNDEDFNIALCELAGHLPFKSESEFNAATEDKVATKLNDVCQEQHLFVRDKIEYLFKEGQNDV